MRTIPRPANPVSPAAMPGLRRVLATVLLVLLPAAQAWGLQEVG